MSLNQIYYNTANPLNKPELDINVNNLIISGNMLRQKAGENENGYILQCYAPGRARFSAPPRFHQFQYALVGIQPNSSALEFDFLNFIADADCIDTNNLIEVTALTTITIKKAGRYLVMYKISRANSNVTVFANIVSDKPAIEFMDSSASISGSAVENSSCYAAEVLDLVVNQELSLLRFILGPEDTPPALVLTPNTINAVDKLCLNCPSYVMLLQIGL